MPPRRSTQSSKASTSQISAVDIAPESLLDTEFRIKKHQDSSHKSVSAMNSTRSKTGN